MSAVEVVSPLLFGMVVSAFVLSCGLLSGGVGRVVRGASRAIIGVAFAGFCLGLVGVAAATPGQNFLVAMAEFFLSAKQASLASMAVGTLFGVLAAFALVGLPAKTWQRLLCAAAFLGTVAGLSALANFPWIRSAILPESEIDPLGLKIAPGFEVQEIHTLSLSPTSIAIGPDGLLYVAGYWGDADHRGIVSKLMPDGAGGFREAIVLDGMNRPHGIAFYDGDLFVSRSGQYSRAIEGRMQVVNTAAVTRATDLNGDGVYDHVVDVLIGLPGAKGGLHQNNGLTFDSEGWMYVTSSIPDDHKPAVHPYDGAILRARPDGADVEVFAQGFRNPYDLVFGPNGDLFGTDNDDDDLAALGDELNHIVRGGHYGHPYASFANTIKVEGAIDPILRDHHFQGIAYVPKGAFPAGYDDSLFLATWFNGQLKRVRLTQSKGGYTGAAEWFADLPRVVDVTFDPASGALYACSYDSRIIYRITPE